MMVCVCVCVFQGNIRTFEDGNPEFPWEEKKKKDKPELSKANSYECSFISLLSRCVRNGQKRNKNGLPPSPSISKASLTWELLSQMAKGYIKKGF